MTTTGLHAVTRMARRLWLSLVGPLMWGVHVLVGYLGGAWVCTVSTGERPRSGADVLILTVTAVAALVTAAALMTALRRSRSNEDAGPASETTDLDRFVDVVAVGTNGFALLAILLEGVWAGWMTC